MKKRCCRCGADLPSSEFYSHPHTSDRLGSACKVCVRRARIERYHTVGDRKLPKEERLPWVDPPPPDPLPFPAFCLEMEHYMRKLLPSIRRHAAARLVAVALACLSLDAQTKVHSGQISNTISGPVSVPGLRVTGTGAGTIRLMSGEEPAGQTGYGTIFSNLGELLSFKPANNPKQQFAFMGGHLGGTQLTPSVITFNLLDAASTADKPITWSLPNEHMTGTGLYMLAVIDPTDGMAKMAPTSYAGPVWAVQANAGKTGSAELAESGMAQCIVDAPVKPGQYLFNSTTTQGHCKPSNSAPVGTWIVGIATRPAELGQPVTYKVIGTWNMFASAAARRWWEFWKK